MKKNILRFSGFILIMMIYSISYANPRINAVTMNPVNPAFGQGVTITVDYCADLYTDAYIAAAFSMTNTPISASSFNNGQIFIVSSKGVDVEATGISPLSLFGLLGNTLNGYTAAPSCADCLGNTGLNYTKSYYVHVPEMERFPSCSIANLSLIVGMTSTNLTPVDWGTLPGICGGLDMASLTWTPMVEAADYTLNQKVDGSIEAAGDLVLFSTDYEYKNGQFTITDNIPGAGKLMLVSYGPAVITGGTVTTPAIGATSGTLLWNMPNRTGVNGSAKGKVWMLLKSISTIAAGTNITSVSSGNMPAVGVKTSSSSVVAGAQPFSISLSQDISAAVPGNTVTYSLDYSVSGFSLTAFEAFDDTPPGIYAGTPPMAWKIWGESGDNGTWTISDYCLTGNNYITASSTQHPMLLLEDGGAGLTSDQLCTGVVQSDLFIDPGTYAGADAGICIRTNGMSGSSTAAYRVIVSIDNAPSPGYLILEKINGGSITWVAGGMPSMGAPEPYKWYTVKALTDLSGNDYIFRVKIWPRGNPEPAGWDVNWTDPGAALNASLRCDGLGTYNDWRPGINSKPGVSLDVKGSFDNFMVLAARSASNSVIYDTLPAGITFAGADAGAVNSGSVVSWNQNTLSGLSGRVNWWGVVTGCGAITNQAAMLGSSGSSPVISNTTVLNSSCGTGATSITKTANPSSITLMFGVQQVTYTIAYENTSASTINNYQIWDTIPGGYMFLSADNGGVNSGGVVTWSLGNLAAGAAGTVRLLANPFLSMGPVASNRVMDTTGAVSTAVVNQPSPTVTETVTFTITTIVTPATATFTRSLTPTLTITETIPASSATFTRTITPSFTRTVTRTVTETVTFTITPISTVAGATSLSKSANPPVLLTPLGNITYTINYTNNTTAAISNYMVWDTVPYGMMVMSYGGGTQSGNVITWSIGNLAASATGSVQFITMPIVTNNFAVTNVALDSMGAVATVVHIIPTATFSPTVTFTRTITQTMMPPAATMTSTRTFTATVVLTSYPTYNSTPVGCAVVYTTGSDMALNKVYFDPANSAPEIDVNGKFWYNEDYIPDATWNQAIEFSVFNPAWSQPCFETGYPWITSENSDASKSTLADTYYRNVFTLPAFFYPQKARLVVSSDDILEVWLNGSMVAYLPDSPAQTPHNKDTCWEIPIGISDLNNGVNVIAFKVGNFFDKEWIRYSISVESLACASVTATPTLTPVVNTSTFTPTRTFTATCTVTRTNAVVNTFTATSSPTVTATVYNSPTVNTPTLTPTACCTMVCTGATPVINVFASYNHTGAGSVNVHITSNIPFTGNPSVTVKPHGNKPAQVFTANYIPLTSYDYTFVYPRLTGYGDIETIKVAYTDVCGNSGTTSGTYEKIAVMADQEHRVYRNVINPDNGERTRVVYKLYGAGAVKIKVFNRKGTLIKELYSGETDGSKNQGEIVWDGKNAAGKTVTSGMYVISIETDTYKVNAKIVVVR